MCRLRSLNCFPLKEVNAAYVKPLNVLLVPSTVFTFPWYDESLEESHWIPSFGLLLAHEIAHGFERESLFGPAGEFVRLWMNPSSDTLAVSSE